MSDAPRVRGRGQQRSAARSRQWPWQDGLIAVPSRPGSLGEDAPPCASPPPSRRPRGASPASSSEKLRPPEPRVTSTPVPLAAGASGGREVRPTGCAGREQQGAVARCRRTCRRRRAARTAALGRRRGRRWPPARDASVTLQKKFCRAEGVALHSCLPPPRATAGVPLRRVLWRTCRRRGTVRNAAFRACLLSLRRTLSGPVLSPHGSRLRSFLRVRSVAWRLSASSMHLRVILAFCSLRSMLLSTLADEVSGAHVFGSLGWEWNY